MKLLTHNPDVLSCIANLSNDEVFTPPEIANAMLDQLAETWAIDNEGENIWENPDVTFLDPFTKSGVFLREITQRLVDGLASEIPDLQHRVNHILTKQVYGIAITALTGLLARRSVYCSKTANGKYSICSSFDDEQGNIWFERTEHFWKGQDSKFELDSLTGKKTRVLVNGNCSFCNASQKNYGRGSEMESHAYAFIHSENIQQRLAEIFGAQVQFDVVIGNPPYQLSDGGAGKSAKPLFQHFVDSAKKLEPRYVSMIIPSRWMAGGKGLDGFRQEMLNDDRIRSLVDYIDSDEAFPGVDIAGGVSYFLWNRDSAGTCRVETHIRGKVEVSPNRRLNEYDVFVRYADALSILKKVWPDGVILENSLQQRMSGRNAFGFGTKASGQDTPHGLEDPVTLISSRGSTYVSKEDVTSNRAWIEMWKTTVSRASPAGGRPDKSGRFYGLSSIRVIEPNVVTTEAYPVVGAFESRIEAQRMSNYLRTKFVRFLLTLRSVSQTVGKATFGFVPDLPMDREWTDEDLTEKYGLTSQEVALIDQMVRPMEAE